MHEALPPVSHTSSWPGAEALGQLFYFCSLSSLLFLSCIKRIEIIWKNFILSTSIKLLTVT
jgi:hypothetical protein